MQICFVPFPCNFVPDFVHAGNVGHYQKLQAPLASRLHPRGGPGKIPADPPSPIENRSPDNKKNVLDGVA